MTAYEMQEHIKNLANKLAEQKQHLLDLTKGYISLNETFADLNNKYNNFVIAHKDAVNIEDYNYWKKRWESSEDLLNRYSKALNESINDKEKLEQARNKALSDCEFFKKELEKEKQLIQELIAQRNALSKLNKEFQDKIYRTMYNKLPL